MPSPARQRLPEAAHRPEQPGGTSAARDLVRGNLPGSTPGPPPAGDAP